jgi:hypothetical protein
MEKTKGFSVDVGKGVSISLSNGYTVSIQWGPTNYCDYRRGKTQYYSEESCKKCGADGSDTAEVAVWETVGRKRWLKVKTLKLLPVGETDVEGYQTPEQVVALLARVARKASVRG